MRPSSAAGCFQRTTRRLALTEAGGLFFDRIAPVVEEVAIARDSVAEMSAGPSGTLRVTTSVSFGERCLVPLLVRFAPLYPKITVDLTLSETVVDIVAEGYDMAVRLGRLANSRLIATRLLSTSYMVAASPDYLAAHEPIVTPGDLSRHECLLVPLLRFPHTLDLP